MSMRILYAGLLISIFSASAVWAASPPALPDANAAVNLSETALHALQRLGFAQSCPPDVLLPPREEELPGQNDPIDVHGMLLFGNDPFFLSHLPMNFPPHDYQAILEVELDGHLRKKALSTDSAPYRTIYPEPFVLAKKLSEKGSFKAALFSGHFERGGKNAGEGNFRIKRIVYFKKLNPSEKTDPKEFLAFGSASQVFLAHRLSGKGPDFDQITAVSGAPNSIREPLAKGGVIALTASKSGALENGQTNFNLPGGGPAFNVVVNPIYTEFEELK